MGPFAGFRRPNDCSWHTATDRILTAGRRFRGEAEAPANLG